MLFIEFGPGTVDQNLAMARAGPFIFGPMLSAGGAIATPAYLTIISGRVANNNQAKAQSLIGFFYSIGSAIGTSMYSTLLFDPSATGQRAVRFCYVTAGIYTLATGVVLCTAWADESNYSELRCCYDARVNGDNGSKESMTHARAEARRPSVQSVAPKVPSASSRISTDKLNAIATHA